MITTVIVAIVVAFISTFIGFCLGVTKERRVNAELFNEAGQVKILIGKDEEIEGLRKAIKNERMEIESLTKTLTAIRTELGVSENNSRPLYLFVRDAVQKS